MSAIYIKPAWADQYPEFYQAVTSGNGDLEFVDEFDVPYWSRLNYVSLKVSHPIFKAERRFIHNPQEMNSLDRLLKAWDEINAREVSLCEDPEWKYLLPRQPRSFPKKLYEEAKEIFVRSGTAFPSLKIV